MKTVSVISAISLAALLVACGGSTPEPEVPQEAAAATEEAAPESEAAPAAEETSEESKDAPAGEEGAEGAAEE